MYNRHRTLYAHWHVAAAGRHDVRLYQPPMRGSRRSKRLARARLRPPREMLGDATLTDRMQQLLDPALGDVRIAAKV